MTAKSLANAGPGWHASRAFHIRRFAPEWREIGGPGPAEPAIDAEYQGLKTGKIQFFCVAKLSSMSAARARSRLTTVQGADKFSSQRQVDEQVAPGYHFQQSFR